ncbi:MAG: arginine--tRNA ligase [Planctomycetes bacterium]|nr:arginine--tRNA ligase [Planctomycetota bacterium]
MGLIETQVAAELAEWPGFKSHGLGAEKIRENLVRPPKDDMGDLAFATFKAAKEAGKSPAQLALELVAGRDTARISKRLRKIEDPDDTADEPVAPPRSALVVAVGTAGPYVNIRLNRAAAGALLLTEIEKQGEAYGNSESGKGKTLVIDLSSPNIAKPLAVHHLRSTMIGYSIKKIRESQGWRVVGVNHLGDWGTGFGKLIAGLKRIPSVAALAAKKAKEQLTEGNFEVLPEFTVKELNAEYQKFNEAMKSDPELEASGKREFALLEQAIVAENTKPGSAVGTPGYENFYIYRSAREKSLSEFARVYKDLGISFKPLSIVAAQRSKEEQQLKSGTFPATGVYIGESHWAVVGARCQPIVDTALKTGVAEKSDGAVVIWVNGKKPGKDGKPPPPVILQKDDGASSYHLRDIASATYRHEGLGGTDLAYVVGSEQSLHFQQLFKALEMLGYEWAKNCTHVDFGLMLFKNDKGGWEKTSTRRGTAIMLEDLLDEAIKSVREIMAAKNPELAGTPDGEAVAHAVGVGAVVFNDLKAGRRNNVKFDWDAVLDFEGESGPYMLYQYVRMGSVMQAFSKRYCEQEPGLPDEASAKAGAQATGIALDDVAKAALHGDAALLTLDEEWRILKLLAEFPDAVAKASDEYEPSVVAQHLIKLAGATSTWWVATRDSRIVGDDKALSLARVRLVNAIRTTLGKGLTLLGMSLVDRM